MSIPFRSTALGGLLLGLAACSGGSGSTGGGDTGGVVEGLSAPDQVSVVTANEEQSVDNGGLIAPSLTFDPDAEYHTDETHSYVYDPSMEALQQVNSILCYLSMTAYDQMVNEGAYIAQIDTSLCESGESQDSAGSDQGQSSGSQGATYEYFTVRSRRTSNSANQIAHIWVPQEGEDPTGAGAGEPETIYVEVDVERGATREDPLGSFSMSFAGAPSYDLIEDAQMRGRINTIDTQDAVAYQFFESFGDVDQPQQEGGFARDVRLVVTTDEDMQDGVAKVSIRQRYNFGMGDSGIQEETWRMAFNGTHFKRQANDGPEVTFSRDEFNSSVWRYFLYHADGENAGDRVRLNSGFPFVTEGGAWGWAGYWGVWVDQEAGAEDGDTVYRQQYGSDELGEAYELVMAPGRLIKNVRNQLDLEELNGVNLEFWDWQSGNQFLVEYSSGSFFVVAAYDHESGTWEETGPELLDPDAYGGFLGFWSNALGGQVNWVDGDDFVTFYQESFVTGSDEMFGGEDSITLYGMIDCLGSGLSAEDAEQGDIYLPMAESAQDAHGYVFSADDLGLYHDVNGDGSSLVAAGLLDGAEPEQGPFTWGMRSGPMVTSLAGIESPWDLWDAEVFYTYETGHNPWNRYSALRDSLGAFVEFDAPLQFLYTHTTAADRNGSDEYNGKSFFLEYNGAGGLHGIPFEPGESTGVDEGWERWYPVFNIADGTLVGPTGTEYVIKAIDSELTLLEDPSGSQALQLAGADLLTLPSAADFETPGNGEKPTVNAPPAVLNGEVLGSDD